MKKLLLILFVVLVVGVSGSHYAFAVPAFDKEYILDQPDGTTFTAIKWGDEYLHGWETLEGFTIVLDRISEEWCFAEYAQDGRLVSSRIPADTLAPADLDMHLRPVDQETMQRIAWEREIKRVGTKSVTPTGTGKLPVLLINFSDTTTTVEKTSFTDLLFGTKPSVATGPGSMRDYYKEVSYGAFDLTGGDQGLGGWYTAAQNHDYYGENGTKGGDLKAHELVAEAVNAAIAGGYNFNDYDSDSDGFVDTLAIIHQGQGEEEGNANDIWSHMSKLSDSGGSAITDPVSGKKIDAYTIQPELIGDGAKGTRMSTIGTISHEFGHALGLPDTYDTSYATTGLGEWCSMAGGADNKKQFAGDSPAHHSVFLKYILGWVTPKAFTGASANVTIKQLVNADSTKATVGDVHMLLDNPNGEDWKMDKQSGTGEYFLVVNRQAVGFDAVLPGFGLFIWHVDESVTSTNECGSWNPHPLVWLEQADGKDNLKDASAKADDGDPYPGSASNKVFNASSTPNSKLYNDSDSKVAISKISASSASMTAYFSLTGEVKEGGDDDDTPSKDDKDDDDKGGCCG